MEKEGSFFEEPNTPEEAEAIQDPTPEDIEMLRAALQNPELPDDEREKIEAIIEEYEAET